MQISTSHEEEGDKDFEPAPRGPRSNRRLHFVFCTLQSSSQTGKVTSTRTVTDYLPHYGYISLILLYAVSIYLVIYLCVLAHKRINVHESVFPFIHLLFYFLQDRKGEFRKTRPSLSRPSRLLYSEPSFSADEIYFLSLSVHFLLCGISCKSIIYNLNSYWISYYEVSHE